MKILGFFIMTTLCFQTAFYAQTTNQEDVKVGLVLSGGGAKGLAHIGVLKIIEESGVRIDYISGTSMGAVVGALYASGYSAAQLEEIFTHIDFNTVLNDDVPRQIKSLTEKEDSERRALTIPFSNFKMSLPSSISTGQSNYNLFHLLFDHVKHIEDFSKLPIPFYCIATNAVTGDEVILNSGSLPEAIAASSALPSVFEPVLYNNQLLIDGGVVNNYPINKLQSHDLDIIIGIDVQDELKDKEQLASLGDVLLQITSFQSLRTMKEKVNNTDLYIKPNIEPFTIISFEKSEAIMASGVTAAEKEKTALEKIANRQVKKERIAIKLDFQKTIQINNLILQVNKKYTRAYILGKLKLKTPTTISYLELNEKIDALSATNNFNKIQYYVTDENELILDVNERKNTLFLKAGIHFDNLYRSAALMNITKKQFLTNNDVVSLDVILGEELRYNFDYYIDKGYYWSLGLKSRYNTFERTINAQYADNFNQPTLNVNNINIEVSDLTNQFYLETIFKKGIVFGIGAEHKKLKIENETLIPGVSDGKYLENNTYLGLYSFLKFDNLNHKYFPSKGFYFNADIHLYPIAEKTDDFVELTIGQAKIGYAQKITKQLSFSIFAESGIRIGNNSNSALDFSLGGFGNNFINNYKAFLGYDFIAMTGDSFVKTNLNVDYEFVKKNHIIASTNFANIDDGLFKDYDWLSIPDYSGYAIGYGLETFLGPAQVKYSWSPEARTGLWFFSIGYWF